MKPSQTPLPQLIHAEKNAKEIIYDARKRRNQLLKKAKYAANKEVENFGAEQAKVLNEVIEKTNLSLTILERKVENTTKDKIAKIDEQVEKNREKVLNMLLKLLCEFEPEVHRNYRQLEN